jgi:hypothetical protein
VPRAVSKGERGPAEGWCVRAMSVDLSATDDPPAPMTCSSDGAAGQNIRRLRRGLCVVVAAMLCAAACAVWAQDVRPGTAGVVGRGGFGALRLRQGRRESLELLLAPRTTDRDGWVRARAIAHAKHQEHARSGLQSGYHEEVSSLRARIHPFGRSRLERGYHETLDELGTLAARHNKKAKHRSLASEDVSTMTQLRAKQSKMDADRQYHEILRGLGASLRERLTEHEYKDTEARLKKRARGSQARQQILVQGPPGQSALAQTLSTDTLGVARKAMVALRKGLAFARTHATGASQKMQAEGRNVLQELGEKIERLDTRLSIGRQHKILVPTGSLATPDKDLFLVSGRSLRDASKDDDHGDHNNHFEEQGDRYPTSFEEALQPVHDVASVVRDLLSRATFPVGVISNESKASDESGRNATRTDIEAIVRDAVLNVANNKTSRVFNDSEMLNRTEVVEAIMSRINQERNESTHPQNVLDVVERGSTLSPDPWREFEWIFGRPYAGRGRQHHVAALIFGHRKGENATTSSQAGQRDTTIEEMKKVSEDSKRLSPSDEKVRVSAHDIDWVFGRTKRNFDTDRSPRPANATADAQALKLLIDAARNITGLLNESQSMVDIAKQSIMKSFVPDREIDVKHAQKSMMSIFHPLKTTRITIQVDKKGKGKVLQDTAADDDEERGQREPMPQADSESRGSLSATSRVQLAHSFGDGSKSMSLTDGHLKHANKPEHSKPQLADGARADGSEGDDNGEGDDENEGDGDDAPAEQGEGLEAEAQKEDKAIDGWRGLQSFGQWLLIALSLVLLIMCCTVLGFICFGCLWAWREFKRQDRWDILFSRAYGGDKGVGKKPGGGGGSGCWASTLRRGWWWRDQPKKRYSNGAIGCRE